MNQYKKSSKKSSRKSSKKSGKKSFKKSSKKILVKRSSKKSSRKSSKKSSKSTYKIENLIYLGKLVTDNITKINKIKKDITNLELNHLNTNKINELRSKINELQYKYDILKPVFKFSENLKIVEYIKNELKLIKTDIKNKKSIIENLKYELNQDINNKKEEYIKNVDKITIKISELKTDILNWYYNNNNTYKYKVYEWIKQSMIDEYGYYEYINDIFIREKDGIYEMIHWSPSNAGDAIWFKYIINIEKPFSFLYDNDLFLIAGNYESLLRMFPINDENIKSKVKYELNKFDSESDSESDSDSDVDEPLFIAGELLAKSLGYQEFDTSYDSLENYINPY